jgi:hypothetical protein
MPMNRARVARIDPPADLAGRKDPRWNEAQALLIQHFRPEGSAHRPATTLRLLHDGYSLSGLFLVWDQYVRCVHQTYGDPVYQDSCVEFFVQPKADRGYFNFEFNCGGAFLANYITDPTGAPARFKAHVRLSAADVTGVRVATSLPRRVEPEINQPVTWWLEFVIPLGVLEKFTGPVGGLSGQVWHGNAYKCGSGTSHPHWAAWSPVDELNFHLPRCFGEIAFD